MQAASLSIWPTWSPAEISCRTFRSSLRGLDWCLAACRISKEFSKTVTNCLIWPWNSTRAGIRLLIANFFSKYTYSVHSRSAGIPTGLLSGCNGIGNWYLATKSKAHLERRSLTWDSISSCSFTYRFIGRWGRSCCCAVTASTDDLSRNWWGRSNSSRFDGRCWERTSAERFGSPTTSQSRIPVPIAL